MENYQPLEIFLPLRMSASMAAALAQKAKQEARGERPNLSATVRRAIRFYVQEFERGQDENTKTEA